MNHPVVLRRSALLTAVLPLLLPLALHAACTSPTANAGSINWSGTAFVFCDGSSWQALGSQWTGGAGGAIYYSGGNVGIGTTAAGAMLDVEGGNVEIGVTTVGGSNTGTRLQVAAVPANGTIGAAIQIGAGRNASYNNQLAAYAGYGHDGMWWAAGLNADKGFGIDNGDDNDFAFIYNTTTTPTAHLTIRASGNVGIGTSAPGARLHIHDSQAAPYTALRISNANGTSATGAAIDFYVASTILAAKLEVQNNGSSGESMRFYTRNDGAGAATEKMRIDSAGNVGIGTTNPGYPLHVNGTAYATGAAGALSDVRHKNNIAPLKSGAIELIGKLRPVSFTWKAPRDDGMKGPQLGFIAQEVEQVLPEIVLTMSDKDKTKGLKPTELIPILVKAVQELTALQRSLQDEFQRYKAAHP